MTHDEACTRCCPFGARFHPAISFCQGVNCMAWLSSYEHCETVVGEISPGPGWEKDGPPRGIGGAVTHRQTWKRPVGTCGLIVRR
jgi:hypothetical protein